MFFVVVNINMAALVSCENAFYYDAKKKASHSQKQFVLFTYSISRDVYTFKCYLLLQFTATGLMIIARNYLEVYPYDRWNAKVNFITEILCQFLFLKTKFSPENLTKDMKCTCTVPLRDTNG